MTNTPNRLLKAFAGIGSRETPPDALDLLYRASLWLVANGWTCRSGGAQGADTACEDGALAALADDRLHPPPGGGGLEVYLPWPSFGRDSVHYQEITRLPGVTVRTLPTDAAVALAATVHPAWDGLRQGARKLHGRNSHQVLGSDLASPASMVLCWTKDGADGTPAHPVTRDTGGTGQALRLAVARGIPILNVARPDHRATVERTITPASGLLTEADQPPDDPDHLL